MSKANEFRITNPATGESPDASLHAPLLASARGEMAADLEAVAQAMRDGMDPADAVEAYAGKDARKALLAAGMVGA